MSNTSPSRRKFMKLLGGGVIVAAVGVGSFVATRHPGKAIEPWKLALGPNAGQDPRHVILSHAILAPNPHNRQPWIADLAEEGKINLYCDLDRRLPETDPFDRQITIGLGCFLELAVITAKQIGYEAEVELFAEGEPMPRLDQRPVAKIILSKNDRVERDPLFAQIFDRRSNKDAYDANKTVSSEIVQSILSASLSNVVSDSVLKQEKVELLRTIAWEAMETEMRTYRTAKESIDLLRIGKQEIEANPDGIDLPGALFETLDMLGLMDRSEMLDTQSTVFKQQMVAMKEPFETANGFIFVKTKGNSRKAQIAAGRSYVRLNLKATELGISMQPWSQSLQEFEEVSPQYKAIREELEISSDETLQMFARIGYGKKPNPAPRWPYETRIRNA